MQTELQTTLQVDKYESRMYVSGYLLPPGDVQDDCEDEADGRNGTANHWDKAQR